MQIQGKNLRIVNRYTEIAYFMQKIAESLILSTIRRIFVVRKRRRKLSNKSCTLAIPFWL